MKTAILTGAGSDIGLSILNLLIEDKWKVIVFDFGENLEYVKEQYNLHEKIISYNELNFNEEIILSDIKKVLGENIIDLVVNVAGINILGNFLNLKETDINNVINVNLKSTIIFTQQIAKHMVENNVQGNIIFISSQHGTVANYDRIPYIMTKAAITAFSKALALELAIYKIRVNSISPTFVITRNNKDLLESPFFEINALNRIPLGKYAKPEDIANAVRFLCDSKNSMITGIDLKIDGGWCIQGGI